MTPPRSDQGFVRIPDAEFEAMLARAAEKGAKRALADVGLDGEEAALDIRDLRSLRRLLIRLVAPHRYADRRAHDHHRRDAGTAGRGCDQAEDLRRRSVADRCYEIHSPTRPAHVAGFSFLEDHMTTDLLRPLARRARKRLALAQFQPGRDRLSRHRQAAGQRSRAGQAAGAARPAGQAADRPFRLSQPRTQPRGRWGNPLEAHGRRGLRHRHVKPRSRSRSRRRHALSASLASAPIRARASCTSTSAPRGPGASGSRSARLPSPRKRRPRAKCWPRAAR